MSKINKAKVKLERKHTCDGDVTIARASVTICNPLSMEDVARESLDMGLSAQASVFGDTGMDDGEYEVRIMSINFEYAEIWQNQNRVLEK